jgi:hypothetical protein
MTTQFPDYPGAPQLPDQAAPSDQADPVPQPPPAQYTDGTPRAASLVVDPRKIARALRLPWPLDGDDLDTVTTAITDAQSDVEAYLGRAVLPLTYTDKNCVPDPRGWYLANYPVLSIVNSTPETDESGQPTGLYTVQYVAGLDTLNNPELSPIERFIRLHALYDPFVQLMWRQLQPTLAVRVTSGSTEGQSATVTDALPVPTGGRMSSPAAVTAQMSLPGSPPTLQTLDRWRIAKRRVYQSPSRLGDAAPWPHDRPLPGTCDWFGRWQTWW